MEDPELKEKKTSCSGRAADFARLAAKNSGGFDPAITDVQERMRWVIGLSPPERGRTDGRTVRRRRLRNGGGRLLAAGVNSVEP